MKKALLLCLTAAVLCVSLVSCAASDKTDTEPPSEAGNAPPSAVAEESLTLVNGDFQLDAVYTYADDGNVHPAVLLIAGSGPSDRDETVGALKPLADIAAGLAARGINSLRVDKRTFKYAASFAVTDGIEEEYLSDCRAALRYLNDREDTGDLYLLGHSLGGQIATALAAEESDFPIKGVILFNSSARSLAAVAADQYIAADPENEETYLLYRDEAMKATLETASEKYYFGASEYYWATLNTLDAVANLRKAGLPALIMNSSADKQSFPADIELWRDSFEDDENVTLIVDDKASHLGYEIDTADATALYGTPEFPARISDAFAEFINGAK